MSIWNWLAPKSGAGGLVKEVGESVVSVASGIKEVISGEAGVERLAQMQQQAEEAAAKSREAQARINAAEAKHRSVFVAGWRPAIGWVCAVGLCYHYLVWPTLSPYVSLGQLDMATMIPLVAGLLGLGGLRTYEKKAGVQDRH